MKINDIILAKVTSIKDYGFFIVVGKYSGLCHISEVSNDYVDDIHNFVCEDENIYVLVKKIDKQNLRLTVSIKDINYRIGATAIPETRKGFLPLKEKLPEWIKEKMDEYNNEKKL